MSFTTYYIRPNITIEAGLVGSNKFYVLNYKGIRYRVFRSIIDLQEYFTEANETFIFDCDTEKALDEYLYNPV